MMSEEKLTKVGINWYPGHMAKTKKEIKESLNLIDAVIELIDARIPISSKNNEIDELIKDKPHLLVMTKIDLCDINKTNELITTYKEKYKVIGVDLVNNKNIKELMSELDKISITMNQKRKEKGLKPRRLRLLIVGIPNVGKSTLINRLVSKKATNVGNKPGITKKLEWIRINEKLELLDTPGILMPKYEDKNISYNLASMTAIKEEVLPINDIAIYILNKLSINYKDLLLNRYGIENIDEDILDTLTKIGKRLNFLAKNSEIDIDRVCLTILRDLRDGRIGKVTFD